MERPFTDRERAPTIESLLLEWQSSGAEPCLAELIRMITPVLERVAARTLRDLGIHDRSAIDDTTSLVFDHLRRLAHHAMDERPVTPFAADRPGRRHAQGDSGAAYLHRLTHDRAIDVARARRRIARHAVAISALGDAATIRVYRWAVADPPDAVATKETPPASLDQAIGRLEPRLRTIIAMLLDGKSQATIAREIGVCEGTVSRLRVRAIDLLRRALVQ